MANNRVGDCDLALGRLGERVQGAPTAVEVAEGHLLWCHREMAEAVDLLCIGSTFGWINL